MSTAKPEFSGVSGHMGGETGANSVNSLGDVGAAWLPIESAPKDGTEVIVLIRPKVIRLGWYFRPSSRTEGWCDENGRRIHPRYWMPLPPAPTPQEARHD